MNGRLIHPNELKSYRTRANLTQSQLAEKAEVSQAYIAKIESGEADPTVSTLEKITTIVKQSHTENRFTAKDIMTKPIISTSPDDKIKKAIDLMDSYEISQMPVIKEKRQIGSVTEDTILRKAKGSKEMARIGEARVKNAMEEPFPMVGSKTEISTLARLLEHEQAILVLEKGELEGIITKADLLTFSTNE